MTTTPRAGRARLTREDLTGSVPDGPSAEVVEAVLAVAPGRVASVLSWRRPLGATALVAPSVERVSRVELTATRCGPKAFRVVERVDGSVIVARGSFVGEVPARGEDPRTGHLRPSTVRASVARTGLFLFDRAHHAVSNDVVADLTLAWFALSVEGARAVERARGRGLVLTGQRSPGRYAEPTHEWDHVGLLRVLRDVGAGTPIEWALRRAEGLA